MHRFRLFAVPVVALALAAIAATPAVAASSAVRVKALHETSVYEAYYTSVQFQYQCPVGSTPTLYVSIEQPGTVAFYDSTSPFEPKPVLICDGEKHETHIGLISPGYTQENASTYEAPYLKDTVDGYGRGTVTVTISANGETDSDTTRVVVQSRET